MQLYGNGISKFIVIQKNFITTCLVVIPLIQVPDQPDITNGEKPVIFFNTGL